jgi:hypothetical protein
MTELRKNDRVEVRLNFTGTVQYVTPDQSSADVHSDDGDFMCVSTSAITLVSPVGWPPETGDMWEADGKLFAALISATSGGLTLRAVDGSTPYVFLGNLEGFKALRPVIKYRKGSYYVQ